METPSANPKKWKLVKAAEVVPKKTKVLVSAMPTTADGELYYCLYLIMSSISCMKYCLTLLFFLYRPSQKVCRLFPCNLDLSQPMNLVREDFEEDEEEEEKVSLPTVVEVQTESLNEQSLSNVMARVLGEPTIEEEVGESFSGIKSKPPEIRTFTFEPNKEGVNILIVQTLAQIIEEVAPIE